MISKSIAPILICTVNPSSNVLFLLQSRISSALISRRHSHPATDAMENGIVMMVPMKLCITLAAHVIKYFIRCTNILIKVSSFRPFVQYTKSCEGRCERTHL